MPPLGYSDGHTCMATALLSLVLLKKGVDLPQGREQKGEAEGEMSFSSLLSTASAACWRQMALEVSCMPLVNGNQNESKWFQRAHTAQRYSLATSALREPLAKRSKYH